MKPRQAPPTALDGRPAAAAVGTAALAAALVAGLAGCESVDRVRERFRDATPHEAYALALADAGLASTALGRDWSDAAERSLAEPMPLELPYRETGYLPPEQPTALGYRVRITRGQRIVVELRLDTVRAGVAGARPDVRAPDATDPPTVFLDLYRMGGDSADVPYHAATADSGALRLQHEPWRGGTFVLRVQPELLRGGRYTLTIFNAASLAFPVDGRSVRSIQSVFGDPRDGGRRAHHGVDIFAPRGTPVMAAADGTTRRVRTTRRGGRVVWIRDARRNQSLYYAHLDSQLVRSGERVRPGDTIGLVGNSGNARTTPPHLHFGIYRRGEGPVDPFPFLDPPDTVPAPVHADLALVGGWASVAEEGARLRATPGLRAPVLAELPRRTPLRVLAASGDWYRVALPDGGAGHVFARLARPIDPPGELPAALITDEEGDEP